MDYDNDEISFIWEQDFPKGYGHTSIAYLKRCLGYEMAKNGCLYAAQDVVMQCIKRNRLDNIREEYTDSFLLPISGRNALPQAFAEAIGLELWDKVFRVDKVQRKSLCAIHRLQHKPIFAGHVEERCEVHPCRRCCHPRRHGIRFAEVHIS